MNFFSARVDAYLNKHHELARKLVHIGFGSFFVVIAALLGLTVVRWLSVASFFIFVLARRHKIFPRMYDVYRTTYGEIFYPIGLLGAALITDDVGIFIIATFVLALADSSASLFGKVIKSPKLVTPYATASLAGSGTFLFVTLTLIFIGGGLGIYEITPSFAILVGLTLTGAEAVSPVGSDNLFLPIITANVLAML